MKALAYFYISIAIFFMVQTAISTNHLTIAPPIFVIFKCLPILNLVLYVLEKFNSFEELTKNKHGYYIFRGLCFSMFADAAMVYEAIFLPFLTGITLFFIAHIFYTFGFGRKKFRKIVFAICVVAALTTHQYINSRTNAPLPPILRISGGFYCLAIFTMVWRAWARVDLYDSKEDTWRNICAGVGSILFVTSDVILCINKFVSPVEAASHSIMILYYAAQLGIAASVTPQNKVSPKLE